VDGLPDGGKRPFAELGAHVVQREETFAGLSSCRMAIDEACG
jgi:hypothetical protein